MTERAPNWSLDAVCEEIESHDLTPAQEADLCGLLLGELTARRELAAERNAVEAEAFAHPDATYRRNMRAAGRGHLIR